MATLERAAAPDTLEPAGTDGSLPLVVRTYQRQPEIGVPCVEAPFCDEELPVTIPARQAAVVLVDVWDTHHIASHAARAGPAWS